jgi:hypothetical protein
MEGNRLESVLLSNLGHIGRLDFAGFRVLKSQQLHGPSCIDHLLREAKPGEHLHGIRCHPDARAYFCEFGCPLYQLDLVTELLQSDCQRQTSDACSLDNDIAVCFRFFRVSRYAHASIVRRVASNRSPLMLAFEVPGGAG